MSTRYDIPTTFALVAVGQPFATAFDAVPAHTKASTAHAHTLPAPGAERGAPVAFEPDAHVYVASVDARYFDVVVVCDDGRVLDGVAAHASTFDEALTVAYDAVVAPRLGRAPHAVAAVLVDRGQPDAALRTRIVDLRVVRPHACDEACVLCDRCMTVAGYSRAGHRVTRRYNRCARTCPHADDRLAVASRREPVEVEFFAREQAGRAGLSRRYDIVEAETFADGTTRERVVEGGFFALSAADDGAAEYQRDHDRDVRRRRAAKTGGAR